MPDPVAIPAITIVEGVQNRKKMRSVSVRQGTEPIVRWTYHTSAGVAINLTDDYPGSSYKLRIKESVSFDWPANTGVTLTGVANDAPNGIVDFTLNQGTTNYPGISIGEAGVFDGSDNLLLSNLFYVVVERGAFSSTGQLSAGPLTLSEIRLFLRDNSFVDNLWLGVEEFDMAELAACISLPIMYFNEAPPPLSVQYNTSNFPWKYNWLQGTMAQLYFLAAKHYRRVHLPYSAGGISIDDKRKGLEYQAEGEKMWAEYKEWVRFKRVQINLQGAMQTSHSAYWGRPWVGG